MSMLVATILHQHQPAQHECVHACLNMITGMPLDTIREQLPARGLDDCDLFPWLVRHGILPVKEHRWSMGALYLVSMASLNYPAKLHMIIVDTRSREKIEVFDPQEGTGNKFIPRDGFQELGCYTQITRLVDCTREIEPGEL